MIGRAGQTLGGNGDDLHVLRVDDVVERGPGTQDDVEPIGVEALQGAPDGRFGRGFSGYSQPAQLVGRGRLGPLGDRDE